MNLLRFVRAFDLIWRRLGPARVYVGGLASAIVVLAAVGAWHLLSFGKHAEPARDSTPPRNLATPPGGSGEASTNASPAKNSAVPKSSAAASPQIAGQTERLITINDVGEAKKKGRHGETLVVATVGLTPKPNSVQGEVEIRVFFFDLGPNEEIRPTDAQVTYEWLTPVRDWNDPTPKYLAATYLQTSPLHRTPESLRYGGFIVRVYAGGRLQDERARPETLLTALPASRMQKQPNPTSETAAVVAATPTPLASPGSQKTLNANTPPQTAPPGPSVYRSDAEQPPYGKPVAGKPGFVSSPFDSKFMVDVRGFPPGTLVNDPNTDKTFRVP